ncbi:diguanylate cyclase [Pseudodesulfovibrio sp. zrk46]|uniref:sensor domain-containing diguanylate cyclase n=1 Tax=Pseudodesulfovibrio sp. zrk46 TaxID=2725288 RepID=UPI001448F9CA|nr:diguanylate cyclase [Pseudodesulfovibrio sp. zrk46]QJB55545.1 diguanylate cyclase [Pseudodesulfovibrio sp. zrk46]
MAIQTGNFSDLGVSYESGTNAALLTAIARSAELLSGKGWPDGVNDLLEALGRVTNVSRVWIFQTVSLTDTHITQNYTFEWAAAPKYKQIGMPMFSMSTNKIDRPEYRALIDSRKRGEWQKTIVHELESGWLRDTLEVQRIKSMLTIPVMVEGEWWGTLGFDDCERAYDWSDVEVALLKTAGYLLSNAVLRDRLNAKRKQFDIVKQITDSSPWAYDFRTGQVWCASDLIHSVPMPTDNFRLSLRSALKLVHPEDRAHLLETVRSYLSQKRDVFRCDVRLFTDCGDLRWVELMGNVRWSEDGTPKQFAGIAVDIRARKREEERLKQEATTDPLTGVMNRRMFERTLQRHIELSVDEGVPFALLLLDIDCFKGLNDKYGHSLGDQVLRNFTSICRRVLRADDCLARMGGDEFAVLLPGMSWDSAREVGERIRRNVLTTPYYFESTQVLMSTSVGVTVHEGGVTSPTRVLDNADIALYAAKMNGRNCLVTTADTNCRMKDGRGPAS